MERGTSGTRDFYDQVGWREQDGTTVDGQLFHDRGVGPVREALNRARTERVRAALAGAGLPLRLLEAGCGGNPAMSLLDLCAHYTGVDFSRTGLELAHKRLAATTVPFELLEADVCHLPFDDGAFDAAYSAHVLYHIDVPSAQRQAFREIARVVRPGGVALFLMANPRPLLFWGQLMRGMALGAPGVPELLRRLKPRLPTRYQIPYRAMPIGWMRDALSDLGEVSVTCHELTSTWWKQHVSEEHSLGRWFWEAIHKSEALAPDFLGCYVQIAVRKR